MIYITLPNFFFYRDINISLIELSKNKPEYFRDNICFLKQEGAFPFMYWAGEKNYNLSTAIYSDYELFLNKSIIPLQIDCSNPLLDLNDLNDSTINTMLTVLQNGSNKLIVSNINILEELQKKYPYYNYIGSEFFIASDPELQYLDKLEKIKITYNNLNNYISIPKNKIEVIFNSPCKDCPTVACLLKEWEHIYDFKKESYFLNCASINETIANYQWKLIEELNQQGYINFCFNTRGMYLKDINYIKTIYINLFVKEEYRDKARLEL